jgi:hypothetical protein
MRAHDARRARRRQFRRVRARRFHRTFKVHSRASLHIASGPGAGEARGSNRQTTTFAMKTIARFTRSTTVRTLGLAAAALVASATAGCAVQADGSPKEGTAAEESNPGANLPVREDFSVTYAFVAAAATEGFTQTDMGPASERTCFLSGVTGNLVADPFPEAGTQVGVEATIVNGEWQLQAAAGGAPLKAFGRCVNTTAGRTAEVEWRTGQSAQKLGAVTATRQCFLTKLITSSAYPPTPPGFSDKNDLAKVWNDGSNWYVGGSMTGWAWASARCVDVSVYEGGWDYDWESTTQLEGPMTEVVGATCALTGVGGNFEFNTHEDQGLWITRDAGLNQFYLNEQTAMVSGEDLTVRGYSSCVK